MALKASEISQLIKERIENFEASAEARDVGTIIAVTDGIVRIHGLADARYGEMLEFPQNTFGLALNLEQDSVGAVVQCLPEIADHFDALKANVENTVDVTVTSAVPLSAAQKKTVAKALKERLGREVNLATEIDENLIGGAVISAGDVVIDGSLRSRLEGLSNALIS